MTTIADWIAEQLAVDDQTAKAAALAVGWDGFGDSLRESGKRWRTRYHQVTLAGPAEHSADSVANASPLRGIPTATHIARHDPARVLAAVAALRTIVGLHDTTTETMTVYNLDGPDTTEVETYCIVCGWYPPGESCPTLLALASVWADRPGFGEWT